MIKGFIVSLPILWSYPAWVRWLMVLWLLYTAILGGLLLLTRRNAVTISG